MPDQNAETYPFARLQYAEGAAPATPAAATVETYAKADGLLYSKDDAGAETLMSSGPATGAPTTADYLVGTANGGLSAEIVVGTSPGGELGGTWASPTVDATHAGGHHQSELDYVEFTSSVSVTATTEATANTVVTGSSVAYDGSTVVMIEFFAVGSIPDAAAVSRGLFYALYEDGSAVGGRIAMHYNPAAATGAVPVHCLRRRTPSNASHVYSIRAWVNVGTGSVVAGDGTGTNDMPGFIRITRV